MYQQDTTESGDLVTINKIAYIEVTKKERGMSYEFCDYDDIAAIVSDTTPDK
jgi:hypothetical protein